MLCCYLGYSNLPEFRLKGHSGGVVSTLSYWAVMNHRVKGVLMSKPFSTFIARSKEECLEGCGSIYEDFPYEKIKGDSLVQVGKPCNISRNYFFKISILCSHVTKPRVERITHKNRVSNSFFDIPFRCLLCSDHVGVKADISVGDYHLIPKTNIVLVHTVLGQWFINEAIKDKYLVCLKTTKKIQDIQPYLYKNWREKMKWIFTKIRM